MTRSAVDDSARPSRLTRTFRDARHFQIAGQALILAVGFLARDFNVTGAQIGAALATAMVVQWLGSTMHAVRFDWRSPLISTLSLALLLRSNDLWPFAFAAAVAIGSKFALRSGGAHVFNPANAGIVAALLFSDDVWTSVGEWGTAPWFALLIAALGAIVTWRASRLDTPIVFLGVYSALLFARAIYLGDPFSIPAMRLMSGELILFAFFMISDPRTTPDALPPRVVFIAATAALAYTLQFHFFIDDGLFFAPALIAAMRALTGLGGARQHYEWGRPPASWRVGAPDRPHARIAPAE